MHTQSEAQQEQKKAAASIKDEQGGVEGQALLAVEGSGAGISQQKGSGISAQASQPGQFKALGAMVQNSPQVQKAAQFQAMANQRSVSSAPVAQRVESDRARNWRKFKRWLSNKKLPSNTYRWDTRPPETIAGVGFQPWDSDGLVSLKEHVRNSSDDDGHAVKYESQWVSTGAFGMIKKIDPTFAQQVTTSNLYKIDTAAAEANSTNSFVDVNKHFDSLEIERPYATQKEWAMEGDGIHPSAVVAWMPGGDYLDQYDLAKNELPVSEANLASWQPMPAAPDDSDTDSE